MRPYWILFCLLISNPFRAAAGDTENAFTLKSADGRWSLIKIMVASPAREDYEPPEISSRPAPKIEADREPKVERQGFPVEPAFQFRAKLEVTIPEHKGLTLTKSFVHAFFQQFEGRRNDDITVAVCLIPRPEFARTAGYPWYEFNAKSSGATSILSSKAFQKWIADFTIPARVNPAKAEQPGAVQPTTKPAGKPPMKVQPSTPTPKDAPR
jgi:hypothetical protein